MSKKKNNRKQPRTSSPAVQKAAPVSQALLVPRPDARSLSLYALLVALVAEGYLLLIRLFAPTGEQTPSPSFSQVILTMVFVGGILALAGVVFLFWQKVSRPTAVSLLIGGLLIAGIGCCALYFPEGLIPLSILLPIALGYALVYFHTARDFFYEALMLGIGILCAWACHTAIGNATWFPPVAIGVFVIMVFVAFFVMMVSMAQKEDGIFSLMKKIRFRLLPSGINYGLLYGAILMCVGAMFLSLLETALTLYLMLLLGAALIALTVYRASRKA